MAALLGGQPADVGKPVGLVLSLHPQGQLWGEAYGAGAQALGPEVLNHL